MLPFCCYFFFLHVLYRTSFKFSSKNRLFFSLRSSFRCYLCFACFYFLIFPRQFVQTLLLPCQQFGHSAFTIAATYAHIKIVRLLLKAGANMETPNEVSDIHVHAHLWMLLFSIGGDKEGDKEKTFLLLRFLFRAYCVANLPSCDCLFMCSALCNASLGSITGVANFTSYRMLYLYNRCRRETHRCIVL
jgi:hypothetical protein